MATEKRRTFESKFKERAVALAKERQNLAQASRELNISPSLLRTWIAACETAAAKGKGLSLAIEEKQELERLRKRLAEEELEIIKKRQRISHRIGSKEICLDRRNEGCPFHRFDVPGAEGEPLQILRVARP